MTMHRSAAITWLALASQGNPAQAETAAPARPQLMLDAQAAHGQYLAKERSGSVVLNQESGTLSGGALAVTGVWTPATLRLSARRLHGDIAYQGYTQLGLPLRTQTSLTWQDWHVWAGPTQAVQTSVGNFGIAVGAGRLVVTRAIRATARSLPLTETLRLGLLSAGGDWQLALPGGGTLHGQLQWKQALTRRLAVDSGTVFDPYDLAPRHGSWAGLGAGLQWPLAAGVHLVATLQHDALRVAAAPARAILRDGRLAGLSSYPGSRQRLQTVAIGLRLAL